jgi:hypothetical protein
VGRNPYRMPYSTTVPLLSLARDRVVLIFGQSVRLHHNGFRLYAGCVNALRHNGFRPYRHA